MKKITLYIFIVAAIAQLYSCKKFLEPEIKTEIDLNNFGKTPQEADLLLTQAYSMLRNANITGSLYMSRFTTDYNVAPAGTVLNQSNLAKMNFDATDAEVYNIWDVHYNAISRTNLIIAGIEKRLAEAGVSKPDSLQFNRINGEARFLRGFLYFNMVRLFRNAPLIEKFFRTFEEIDAVANKPADQMWEQENLLYNFIIDDFTKASQLLPESTQRGRAGKYAALAYLGKTYLNRATIIKHRDKTGDGAADYQKAFDALNAVVQSGVYDLKDYFPDNFIRDKQHTGKNEFLFTLEFDPLDGSGSRFGDGGGSIVNNSGAEADIVGASNGANGGWLATDFGWSVFDVQSPGDIVRRFWTLQDISFVSLDVNGISGIQNTAANCPGPNCEVFLRTQEPYQFARPYWFEVVNSPNAFRYSPTSADVATSTTGSTYFTTIWGGGSTTNTPEVRLVKFRRTPYLTASYTNATYDADLPVMRYAEVLLMYAEAANELVGPATVPPGATLSAVAAVNKVRNRARNFVHYADLNVNSRILPNSPYTRTYKDIYQRAAKVGTNPPLTANATDTFSKYFYEISAFKGVHEVPSTPSIRNFKEFPQTANYVPDFSTSLSQSQFRNDLLDERWRELAGEQNMRWYDLTRYGQLVSRIRQAQTAMNPLTNRDLSGTAFASQILQTAPFERYQYLPIPRSEISRNANLKQNALY